MGKRVGLVLVVASVVLLDLYLLGRQSAHLAYTPLPLVALVMFMMSFSLIMLGYIFTSIHAPPPAKSKKGVLMFLAPSYISVRLAASRPLCLAAGIAAGLVYSLLYMWSVGIIAETAMQQTFVIISEGPPGYAPIFMFFPLGGVGVIIPAYQVGIVALFSTIVSLTTTVLTYSALSGLLSHKGIGSSIAGATSGLLLSCPTCITPPLVAIMTAYLAPWGLSFIIGILRGSSGTLLVYISSLVLLWVGFSTSSNALERGISCPSPFS